MKLLLDENLSFKIVEKISDLFPGSSHVRHQGLMESPDADIWEFAGHQGYCVVSKDEDFHQLSILRGHPPKFLFLKVGNCTTSDLIDLIRREAKTIQRFGDDEESSLLVI